MGSKVRRQDLDWDARYSPEWKTGKVQAIAHERVNGRCCYCFKNPSQEIHHCEYRNFLGLVKHNEQTSIGLSLFPACKQCHEKILHDRRNWRYDEADPVFGSGNTPEITSRLRFGFKLLSKGTK